MFSLRWDSGLLRSLGQALTAVLVAASFALMPQSVPQAQASGVLPDGSNSVVDYAADAYSNSFYVSSGTSLQAGSTLTFEAWVKPRSLMTDPFDHVLVAKHFDYAVAVNSGEWVYWAGDGNGGWGTRFFTGVSVSPGAWIHISLLLDGNNAHFFVNGHEVDSTNTRQITNDATSVFSLGDWNQGVGRFDAEIDEVRVWSTNRTAQLASDMHTKVASNASGLLAYWDFNEGFGTTIHDRTGNYDLTVRSEPDFLDVKQTTAADDGDTIMTFPRTYLPGVGGWQSPVGVSQVQYLVVGGGGAGSRYEGGGGGGGGFNPGTEAVVPGAAYEVKVGAGGQAINSGDVNVDRTLANPGQPSTFSTVAALGGGGGGAQFTNGGDGGTGAYGGGGGGDGGQSSGSGGVSLDAAWTGGDGSENTGGGGAGAGGAGANGTDGLSGDGGAGGSGASSAITGQAVLYSGGGGGGSSNGNAGAGGSGGGGNGGGPNSQAALPGDANTGGGGGGSALGFAASGGSGVVILRYTSTIDTAVELDAVSNNHLLTTSSLVPATFTFEAWVRPSAFSDWGVIYSQGGSFSGDTALWTNDQGELRVEWGGTSQAVITGFTLPLNQWTHLAVSRDGSSVPRLYINSNLFWTGAANSGSIAGTFKLGQWYANSNNNFIGEIDQVKVWNSALDASDLAKSMHTYSTSGVSVAGNLVAHFDMNEGNQEFELDRSGNGNHLTKVSVPTTSYSSSTILETGNASAQDIFFKFNRSYLTATGGWTPPVGVNRFSGVAVAGGGPGGSRHGGGGGAGELALFDNANLGTSPITVIVGQGGMGVPSKANTPSFVPINNGQNTQIGNTVLSGGGRGVGIKGGSGGGAKDNQGFGASSVSPSSGAFTFYGNSGGQYILTDPTVGFWAGGGGGGASTSGENASSAGGGSGGSGLTVDLTGVNLCLAAGGGGGAEGGSSGMSAGAAGGCPDSSLVSGGAGSLGYLLSVPSSAHALPNSGSGGGGGGHAGDSSTGSGSGGSGVVILSYSLAPDAPTSLLATQTTTHATIDLSWTAPTYTGNSSITGYDIEYKPVGGSWISHSSVASSPANVQLPQQCIAHEFRVIAKNSSFQSVASATASATPVWGTFGSLTGVQISSTNSECVVTFTSTTATTWTPPSGTTTVEALLVGGGGGGGAHVGGGGGGGGVTESVVALTPNTAVNVDVGAGGAGASKLAGGAVTVAEIGESTVFGSLTAFGGGAGMSWETATPTGNFATSGGATGRAGERVALTPTVTGQGFKGGDVPGDNSTSTAQPHPTGGGGGAGGAGGNADVANNESGDGGVGFASDITGTTIRYGGGGGGGIHGNGIDSNTGVVGQGADGGGNGDGPMRSSWTGDASGSTASGQAGTNGLGGGGGGAGADTAKDSIGGQGGSGLVVLRQLSIGTPAISAQPQDASAEPGQTKTLTVAATGNGTLSYQWQSSTDGTSWTNVGTNSSAFTTGTLALSDNGIQYRVVVTNTLNNQTSVVTSSVAVISVVGVTIGTGLCETMVSNDSGATVSQTAAGGCLLEFTTPGNNMWFVPNNVSSVEALVVGGGGGGASGRGGSWFGGGGGGGGAEYVKVSLVVTTSQQIPLVVGAGGSPGGNNQNGASGENSSFSVSSAVATGGSGGLASTALSTGGSGGSGGLGSGVGGSRGGDGADGLASRTFQRPTAGSAANSTVLGGEQFCLGGGGGGGNRGVDNTPHFYFQAQGGGCSALGLSSGGAGRYFNGSSYLGANPGVANSGGGGGGGSYISGGGSAGAAGGSGLVALYYVPGAGDITLSQPDAMSYSSTANTTSITLAKTSPGSAAWTTSNQTICTVTGDDSGATVTVLTAGVCAVSVTVGAAGGYSTGSAEVSFRIDRTTQPAPTWDAATATVAFGGTVDLYEKLNNPGLSANYTFTVSGTGCSVTGLVLTVGNAGSNCVVTPTLNETNKYLASSGTNFTVSVTKISQSALVLTSATSMNVDQTLTLSAAGGTGDGALTYHVLSAENSASCVIANSSTGVLDPSSAGSCEVYAKRASSTNYDEVTSSHVVITVNKISQNLSWVSQPQAQYVAGNTYALEATASSQLAVAYSISSGLCTLAGNTVTFTGSGDCVIQAGQAGDGSYLPAVTISQTVSVGKINQTMTFSALADKSWGSLAFSLSATASSGLNIAYTENNQTTNDACDVSANGIVTIKNVGTCAITATQAGDSAYTAVTTTRLFDVTANQAGAPFIGSVSFGDRQLNASFFTPSYLGGGTVSAYELQAHPLGGGAVVKNTGCIPQQGPSQTCSVTGLTNGVTYELKVAAITQAGLGQLSASSSEVTPAANPEAVGNLVAIEGNGTLTLQWTPPTNLGGGAFDQYRIYWKAPGGSYQANGSPGASIGTQASTSFVITGLQNGTSYDVKVITTTGVNTAELQSNTAEVRQTPFTVPDAPAAVVALDNDNNVVVAWQAPVFDGGNPIDQYVVKKGTSTVCTITSATTTSCEISKPSPGTTEVIEVRAGNDAGLSAPVSTSITVAALPGSTPPGLIGGGGFPGVTPGATAPIVLDVSGSATVQTNELIRLVGTNLNMVEKVLIGNIEASFFVNSAQLITIRIPVEIAAGNPTITLQGSFGTRIFSGLIQVSVTQVSVDTKVTIGTFLGYAAVYTKNHEGKRLSMKIGNKWRVIESLGANYTYNLTKVGAGKTVTVMVYLDRQLVQIEQIKVQ